MRSCAPLALVVGTFAGAAAAQSLQWTWLADVEHPVIDPSKGITTQTVTLSVLMEFDAPWVVIDYTIFDTIGALNADLGHITEWKVLNDLADLTGDLTTTDGVSLFGTNAGQLCLFGPCTSDNPVDVLRFTWEVDRAGAYDVTYLTDTSIAYAWIGENQDVAKPFEADILNEVVVTWKVVPAPAALALGVPLLMRRRRRPRASPTTNGVTP
jgi:hypothetical protein